MIKLEMKANTQEHLKVMLADLLKSLERKTSFQEAYYIWENCWFKFEDKEETK